MSAFVHGLRERFTDRFDDPAAMQQAFEDHNAAVRAEIAPERLLEWTAADGWDADLRAARPAGARRAVPGHQHHQRLPLDARPATRRGLSRRRRAKAAAPG